MGRCYLCKKEYPTYTRDHFVPKAALKAFEMWRDYSLGGVNIMPACLMCNRSKNNKLLFPPIHTKSWWPEEYAEELGPIQERFYHLAKIILRLDTKVFKSPCWEQWVREYEDMLNDRKGLRFKEFSDFDQFKVYLTLDYDTLRKDIGRLYRIEAFFDAIRNHASVE